MRYGRILAKKTWYCTATLSLRNAVSWLPCKPEESNHGWVNDPTSAVNLQLNELIEHIATFALNYKIKYAEDNKLIAQVDEYLDDTFTLFSNYGINSTDLQKWKKSGNRLFRCFVNASRENPASLSC